MIRSRGDQTYPPKYALFERERRWLVDRARLPDLSDVPFVGIEDRYILGTRLRLRRMTDGATGASVCKLTKKYETDDPIARPIVTAYLAEDEYRVVAVLPAHQLTKRRHKLVIADRVFGIDVFEASLAPLVIAEIEAEDDAALKALHAPAWAIREVSTDPRYQGAALAAGGPPEDRPWPKS